MRGESVGYLLRHRPPKLLPSITAQFPRWGVTQNTRRPPPDPGRGCSRDLAGQGEPGNLVIQ